MKKIEQFQITSMSISGFKSYEKPTELTFGNPTVITGGNGRGKTSIADAIAFAVTGLPLFGERGLDRLHNEKNPDVAIQMRFVDENGITHELTRIRRNNDMSIYYDGHTIRQLDLADLFGERDVFLSILNPLYFIEELGTSGKNLLERYLPFIPQETILAQLPGEVQASLKDEVILSPDAYLKGRRAEIRELEERITYLGGQKDLAATQKKQSDRTDHHGKMREQCAAAGEAYQTYCFRGAACRLIGGDPVWPSDNMIRSLSWKRPDGVGLSSTPERCGERRSRQAAPSAMTTDRENTI